MWLYICKKCYIVSLYIQTRIIQRFHRVQETCDQSDLVILRFLKRNCIIHIQMKFHRELLWPCNWYVWKILKIYRVILNKEEFKNTELDIDINGRWRHNTWHLTSNMILIFNVYKLVTPVMPMSKYKVSTVEDTVTNGRGRITEERLEKSSLLKKR